MSRVKNKNVNAFLKLGKPIKISPKAKVSLIEQGLEIAFPEERSVLLQLTLKNKGTVYLVMSENNFNELNRNGEYNFDILKKYRVQ